MAEKGKSPLEILFPKMKISHGAYAVAQEYINETIRQKGVVESYMYGFRRFDDPDHIISEIYFPHQKCSRKGVEVDQTMLSRVFKKFREQGFCLSAWLHHHCYGRLRPSGPNDPEINDIDGSGKLLNEISYYNYKKRLKTDEKSIDEYFLERLDEQRILLEPKDGRGLGIVLNCKDEDVDLESLAKVFSSIGTSMPVHYAYINCIIMNPTIENPNFLAKAGHGLDRVGDKVSLMFDKKEKQESFIGEMFQPDVYKDPYAGIFWKKWTPLSNSSDYVKRRQVELDIVGVPFDIEVNLAKISREVEYKAIVSNDVNEDYFRLTPLGLTPREVPPKGFSQVARPGDPFEKLLIDPLEKFLFGDTTKKGGKK